MDANSIILGFPEYETPAHRLAQIMGLPYKKIKLHSFPDAESLVRLPEHLPEHVILCRSLNLPNDKLIELMLSAATARNMGVQKITLVAPYLCYMRQDKAFRPGESVSQTIIAEFITNYVDTIITVDPHLHRISTINEVFPSLLARTLSSSSLIGDYLGDKLEQALLVGPDSESGQWVRAIAEPEGLDYVIAEKIRIDDHTVTIKLPEYNYKGRNCVIVDDIASTGRTLATTAEQLKLNSSAHIYAMVTHALFVDDAESVIHASGIDDIWSTDSIPHHTNAVNLAPLLAQALKSLAN